MSIFALISLFISAAIEVNDNSWYLIACIYFCTVQTKHKAIADMPYQAAHLKLV